MGLQWIIGAHDELIAAGLPPQAYRHDIGMEKRGEPCPLG